MSSGATSSRAAARRASSRAGELGLPGVTVELRSAAGKTVQSDEVGANGTFDFAKVPAGTYHAAIGAQTFAKPFGGFAWLGPKLITPSLLIAYIWIWAGLRDGGDRGRAGGDAPRRARGRTHRRSAPSGRCSGASPCRSWRRS